MHVYVAPSSSRLSLPFPLLFSPRCLSSPLVFRLPPSFAHTSAQVTSPREDAPPPVRLGILQNCDRFFPLLLALTYGASMKITYTGLTGDPVRSIDGGASAARRAVKTILKNLKWWCARSWRGKAVRAAPKGDRRRGRDQGPSRENNAGDDDPPRDGRRDRDLARRSR